MIRALLVLVPFGVLTGVLAGCASVARGGAVGFDAGTVAVSGVETGVGLLAEAIAYPWDGRGFGLGPSAQVGGYASAGDGDPIAFTTLEVRCHSVSEVPTRPYLQLGTGAGVALTTSIHDAAVPVQMEVGLERQLGRFIGGFGLRERFVGLIGSGDPGLEAFNSVQLVLGVRLGRFVPRPE